MGAQKVAILRHRLQPGQHLAAFAMILLAHSRAIGVCLRDYLVASAGTSAPVVEL